MTTRANSCRLSILCLVLTNISIIFCDMFKAFVLDLNRETMKWCIITLWCPSMKQWRSTMWPPTRWKTLALVRTFLQKDLSRLSVETEIRQEGEQATLKSRYNLYSTTIIVKINYTLSQFCLYASGYNKMMRSYLVIYFTLKLKINLKSFICK